MSPRMPGERLTVRGTSEVGRFPGAAPPTRVELTVENEGEKKQEKGGCCRWFRKMCPCCCKRQNSTSYDVTDKVEFVKPLTPDLDPEPVKPKPENGEAKELEGNESCVILNIWRWLNSGQFLHYDVSYRKYQTNSSTNTHTCLNLIFNPSLSEMKLSVCSVDLMSSKTSQNRREHHTDLYHEDELIIRRGQTFQIELELNRPFKADTHKLYLDLKTGMRLMEG